MPQKLKTHKPHAFQGPKTPSLYNWKWRKAAKQFLIENPLCAECLRQGKTELAEVVDHIRPHKGDLALFWNSENWQPLSRVCHNRKTAAEDGGFGR